MPLEAPMQDVKLGRYKVAYWFAGTDPVMFSQMFDYESEARDFASHVKAQGYLYTLMESQGIGDGSYSWKLLSGGVSPYFGVASTLYKLRWPLMIASGAYFFMRKS